jgi:hypothetical protein
LANQKERSHIELKEYEAGKPLDEAELQRRQELARERKRQAHQDKLEKQRNRRSKYLRKFILTCTFSKSTATK